ncbi:MAG: tetratricopeptide repeat protein, partial [Gemmatimonadaceae bacterium]
RLDRAESLYYAAVRVRPRDPAARFALGRFLAERGAQRVAVPLFEEALQFGGDATTIGAELAPLYLALGEYQALATLPSSPLTSGEKARASWLEAHPTRFIAPDSVLVASYRDVTADGYLGRIPIRVNGRAVDALIEPTNRGLVLSDSAAGVLHVRMFVEKEGQRERGAFPAAADSLGIGRLSITNAPLSVAPIKVPATIGLDALARFAPTFDPRAGRVTLRVSGSVEPPPPSALSLSTLVKPNDWLVLEANGWLSLREPAIARLLHEKRWTVDAKRGQLVLE